MRPIGPDVPESLAPVLKDMQDAIRQLQNPGRPLTLGSVALKTSLPDSAAYPNGYILCAEINSVVASTLVAGAWTWLRADGSSL